MPTVTDLPTRAKQPIDVFISLNYGLKGTALRKLTELLGFELDLSRRDGEKMDFSLRVLTFSIYRCAVVEAAYPGHVARLRYFRSNDNFTAHRRSFQDLSRPSLLAAVDTAIARGLIEGEVGYKDRRTGRGYWSYFTINESARELVRDIAFEDLTYTQGLLGVILKDKSGNLLRYTECDVISVYRNNLSVINETNFKHRISLPWSSIDSYYQDK